MGADCWLESNWVGWEDLEGVRMTSWRAVPGKAAGMQKAHIKGEAPSMAGAGHNTKII